MAQQQHCLGLGVSAVKHRHQAAFLGMVGGGEEGELVIGEAGGARVGSGRSGPGRADFFYR